MARKISKVQLFMTLTLIGGATTFAATHAQAVTAPNPVILPTPATVPDGQDGAVDTSFGTHDDDGYDGYLEISDSDTWRSSVFGSHTLLQTDGKILSFVGIPDPNVAVGSISTDSTSTAPVSTGFMAETMQSFGANSVGAAIAPSDLYGVQRRLSDGQVDPTFGSNGTAIIDSDVVDDPSAVTESQIILTAMAIQGDGKIVITGTTDRYIFAPTAEMTEADEINASVSTVGTPFVLRMLSDGSMDPTFGNQGVVFIESAQISDGFTSAIVIQRDGKIVVSGTAYDQNEALSIGFVARFHAAGIQDDSFATDGVYFGMRSEENIWSRRIFQQTDGKFVVIGDVSMSSDNDGFTYLERLSADGQTDLSYGFEGLAMFAKLMPTGYLRTGAMQADNKVLFFEYEENNQTATISKLIRVDTNGTIDETFGTNGEVVFESDNGSSWGLVGLTIQPDGKIIVTGIYGESDGQIDGNLVVARLRSDGSPDYTFGSDGVVVIEEIPNLYGLEVVIQPNGQILISGLQLPSDASNIEEFLVRLNATRPASINGLTPSRLADTRKGSPQGTINVAQQKYGGSSILELNTSGVSGLPLYGIGSVILHVTATEPESDGYLSVYACGTQPETSHLNFVTNQTISTSVTTEVSLAGKICIYASAATNIIVDVNGWSAPNTGYVPIAPVRLFDTRPLSPHGFINVDKKKYGESAVLRVQVAGVGSLPSSQFGSLNMSITVTEPTAEGYLTVYPCGTRPLASSLNFTAGQTISSSVTTPVSSSGEICIYSSVPTNLIADAFGWFVQGSGVTPVGPTRLVDTRAASPQGTISVKQKKYGATDELRLPLNGVAGLPNNDIGTVQLTVTATNPNTSGFITVYPCGTLPLASNLNYTTGQTVAVSVTSQVSDDGQVCIYSSASTDVIVDINGWGNQPRVTCDGSILEISDAARLRISIC
jgi:uncharacterized delta-60 repeat protein